MDFDEAGQLLEVPGSARSHALPNAIPFHRRIPSEYAEDWDYHMSKRTNTTTHSIAGIRRKRKPFFDDGDGGFNPNHMYTSQDDNRALYLYNPSILSLYPSDENDPDRLLRETLEALTGGDPQVQYVAIFRANTGSNCFGPDRKELMGTGEQISYLAVGLLDGNLDLIRNSDVLVDLNTKPLWGEYFHQFREDCRIFAVQGSIYLLCNERIFPIQIERRKEEEQHENDEQRQQQHNQQKETKSNVYDFPFVFHNIYGNGLKISLLDQDIKVAGGKNINIFRSLVKNKGAAGRERREEVYLQHYVQVIPLPHTYKTLDIEKGQSGSKRFRLGHNQESSPQGSLLLPRPSFDGPDTLHLVTTCPENEKPNTWITNCTKPTTNTFFVQANDKYHDHGNTCCLEMNISHLGGHVLVGITHTKTSPTLNPWWRRDIYGRYSGVTFGKRYVSRLVAYQPYPPFTIVGRTGWFCLGPSRKGEAGGNSLAGSNAFLKLDLWNATYNCPMIHFISGLVDYTADRSKAILSYGINDCYPRMILVEKKAISNLFLDKSHP